MTQILMVTHEVSAMSPVWALADRHAWHIETVASAWEALERIESGAAPDLFLLDLAFGDTEGLHIVRWLRRVRADMPVLLFSYANDPQQRTEALRLGVQEYLAKPLDHEQVELAIKRHVPAVVAEPDETGADDGIEKIDDEHFFLAFSPAMHKLRAQAALLAQSDAPVLIVGEEGSGRETIARLIHKLSIRSGFPFSKISGAALTGDLLESEIFGHNGTGRSSSNGRTSALERCENGTILLEEISEMPLHLQARIMQMIQQRQAARLRGESHHDVRLMAMAGAHPEHMLAEHKLRPDLYYCLSAFTIHVPSLRQRRDEIPFLLGHFTNRLARHYGLQPRPFSSVALDSCQRHSWPGNLAEMQSFVKRYLLTGEESPMASGTDRDFEAEFVDFREPLGHMNGHVPAGLAVRGRSSPGLKSLVETVKGEAERNVIANALEQTRWNRKAAARLLKVSYRTLLYKIQQYNMNPAGYLSSFADDNGMKGNGSSR